MIMKKSLMILAFLFICAMLAYPQGRGKAQGQPPGKGQRRDGAQTGQGEMDRDRMRATSQQQDRIRACDKLADGVRNQARKMGRISEGKFNADQARKQRDRLQEQVRTMEREHERLVQGLDATQNQAWQERIRNMNRLREQFNNHLQQMNQELNTANPDAKRIAERAREMDRTMTEWRKQYSALSEDKTL